MREAGQDGDELRAGDGVLRAEGAVLIAVYQRKAGHLVNSRRIPCVRCNVREYIVAAAGLLDQQAGQQLAGLGAGDGGVRTECAVLIAVHILDMVSSIERGRLYRRHVVCGNRTGGDRQRACRDQRGKRRCGKLLFHSRFSPFHLYCAVRRNHGSSGSLSGAFFCKFSLFSSCSSGSSTIGMSEAASLPLPWFLT